MFKKLCCGFGDIYSVFAHFHFEMYSRSIMLGEPFRQVLAEDNHYHKWRVEYSIGDNGKAHGRQSLSICSYTVWTFTWILAVRNHAYIGRYVPTLGKDKSQHPTIFVRCHYLYTCLFCWFTHYHIESLGAALISSCRQYQWEVCHKESGFTPASIKN